LKIKIKEVKNLTYLIFMGTPNPPGSTGRAINRFSKNHKDELQASPKKAFPV
jgi:hypothetical protein